MKCVILCGGKGTRIRDASESLPKPMLPIGDKPIVWHIMKTYAQHGVKEFILCLGYRGWVIKEFFLNYRAKTTDITVTLSQQGAVHFHGRSEEEDWAVTLAETGEETMTAGRIAAIRRYIAQDDLFLATYGDGVAAVDIDQLVAFHRSHGKVATVTAVRPPGRFGEMRLAGATVQEFNEKPQTSEGFINGGYFVFDAHRIWSYLGSDPTVSLEREPLQGLARDGQLVAFLHPGFWQPMDTLREFSLLNELWASGRAPWKRWTD